MNALRSPQIFGMIFLIILTTFSFERSLSISNITPNASINLAPIACVTQSGGTGGQPVSNLAVMNQTGTQDNPSSYVTFKTPGGFYQGHCRFFPPSNIQRGAITTLQVKANYKGPAQASQTWTWYLYNWTAKSWVSIGNNSAVIANKWKLLTFNITSPIRFINSNTREIRLQLRSNNASGDAKLDYESISLGYNFTATPTKTSTQTPTLTVTATPTEKLTLTTTHTPTLTVTNIVTATPTETATPTPTVTPTTSPTPDEIIYTSINLSGHEAFPEGNPGGGASCPYSQEDVHVASYLNYGEVISNYLGANIWVNAIGYKKFTESFPNGYPLTLGTYRYSGQFRIPVLPAPDINQRENSEAVHLMIQLWDGRNILYPSNKTTLEGAIYWQINPWLSGYPDNPDHDGEYGKIKVYTSTQPIYLHDTGKVLTPDLEWHSFELAVDFVSQRYIHLIIDGTLIDLSDVPLAQVHHDDWGDDVSLTITTESLAAFPQQDCSQVFTWTTQFKNLAFQYFR